MHDQIRPVRWRDIAAAYDPRGLPFLRFFLEVEPAPRRSRQRRGRT